MADLPRKRLPKPQRRAEILNAARRVFIESGLQGARMIELARAADVNPGLIYQHFESKEELFREAVVAPLQEIIEHAHESVARPPTFEDSYAYFRRLLETLVESLPLLGVVLFTDREAGTQFYRDHLVPMFDAVAESMRRSLGDWAHRDFDPAVVAPIGFGMCWGLVMDAAFRGVEVDVDAATRTIHDMALHGLSLGDRDVAATTTVGDLRA